MIFIFHIAVIIFDAWYQAFHIEKNRFNIPHGAAAKLVSMFAIMANLLIALYLYQVSWKALVYCLTYCIQFIGLRAVLFDPFINKFRGKEIFYETPATKGDISKIDLWYRKQKHDSLIRVGFLILCYLINFGIIKLFNYLSN